VSSAGSPSPSRLLGSASTVGAPFQDARSGWSRRWFAAAAVAAALVPIAGCSSGIQAETSRERPTIDGVGNAVGTLTLRNMYVGGPAEQGQTAPVLMSVFNNGTEPDRLLNVSSPEAAGSSVPPDVTLPSGGQQLLYTVDRAPRLTGLNQAIRPGQIVSVVFTFERSGELRVDLPVSPVTPDLLQNGESPAQSASASGAPSPAVPATPPGNPATGTPPPVTGTGATPAPIDTNTGG
jgi:copper(I)-binding protein